MTTTRRPIWIFDLDDTLHHASPHVFPHINRSMTAYLMQHLQLDEEQASWLRVHYWHRYGATLNGMMRHHGTNPHHFLQHTHDIADLTPRVRAMRGVGSMLRRLPGRKFLFTNGPHHYAQAVVRRLRLQTHFEAIVAIEAMGFAPKPQPQAYQRLLRRHRLPARRCVLVDDAHANIRTAHRLGMGGIWLSGRQQTRTRVPRLRHVCLLPRLRRYR